MTGSEFFKNVQEIAGLKDKNEAQKHCIVVCSALAMRLFGGEGKDFVSQLPHEIKDPVSEVLGREVKWDLNEFLEYVVKETNTNRQQAERSTKAVFQVLKKAITAGEVDDMETMMPKDLQRFFKSA